MKRKILLVLSTVLILSTLFSINVIATSNISVYVDNELTELTDANGNALYPFIQNGTTYVPLRGISQALGCWVRWDGQTKTVSVYMNICPPDGVTLTENKPYDVRGGSTYYESNGEKLQIDGVHYTNALRFDSYPEQCAYFNPDGKYDSLTMTVGSTDRFECEKTIEFVVDGKIIDTHIVSGNSGAENVSIDLNKGLQLKIILTADHCVGMGNIIFWGE